MTTFNLADLFEQTVDTVPTQIAVVSGDKKLTFAEFDERANRVANYLRKKGVREGQNVGLCMYNSNEFLETLVGLLKIRAVPVNLNYRYLEDELRYVVDDSELVGVVYHRLLSPLVSRAAARASFFLSVDDGSGGEYIGADYEEALAESNPRRDFGPRSSDDHYIIYTGGTTGMPRGVIWRHEDMFFSGLQGGNPGGDPIKKPEDMIDIARSGDRIMNILPSAPFIHGAAQWAAFIGMFTGGRCVVSPSWSFDAKRVLELMQSESVTVINLVGDAMATPLVEAFEEGTYDVSALAVISSAGAILSAHTRARLEKAFPGVLVLNSFGASETGHQGTVFDGLGGGSGRPSFYMDDSNVVLDDDLKPVVPGSNVIGRLARRGYVPVGYYNDPKKSAETFKVIDGVRHALPGDLAMVEADGSVTILGRGTMSINSGGEKIFPEEVEEVVKSFTGIQDVIIVGVPDKKWGERVAAVVSFKDGTSMTLEEVSARCREKLAGYKVPRELVVVDEVQRTVSGKPNYRWAKEVACSSTTARSN